MAARRRASPCRAPVRAGMVLGATAPAVRKIGWAGRTVLTYVLGGTRHGICWGGCVGGWWAYLDERTRQEVDADVLRDRRMMAVRTVWEALRPLELGLREAEQVVHARYEALGDRVQHSPPDPLDIPSLAIRAAAYPGRVAAVEAFWDGDTVHDWFVLLVAVLDHPTGKGTWRPSITALVVPRRPPPRPRRAGPWPTTSECRSTSPPRTSPMTTLRAGGRSRAGRRVHEGDGGRIVGDAQEQPVRRPSPQPVQPTSRLADKRRRCFLHPRGWPSPYDGADIFGAVLPARTGMVPL